MGDWGAGSDWGAGRDPSEPSDESQPQRPREDRESTDDMAPPRFPRTVGGPDDGAPVGLDPVAVLAVGVGLLGIVVFGIVAAIASGILGAIAGQRARESGRSFDLPYLAFALAALDGVVWIALHVLFEISYTVG